MKRTFLIGVAAGALIAGANIASAQTMERGGAGAGAEMRGGASMEQKGGNAGASQKGSADIKANTPAGNSRAQAPDKAPDNMKSDNKAAGDMKAGGSAQQKAQDTPKGDSKANAQTKSDSPQNAQSKPDASKSGTAAKDDPKAKSSTTGQGSAAGASKTLTVEQKTKIRNTVIKSSNAPRVTNVNFSLSVGTVVPRTVRYAPLPTVLVEYYPSWRGYDYFIVGDQIVIVEPGTLRIVAVLDV